MPTTPLEIVNDVLLRLDDIQAGAHDRDLVTRLLSHSQRAMNGALKLKRESFTLTLSPRLIAYSLPLRLPRLLRVEAVRYLGQDLERTTLAELKDLDLLWLRGFADRPEVFLVVGDQLLVYPSIKTDTDVEVIGTVIADDITDGSDSSQIVVADEKVPAVKGLLTGLLLLRWRKLDELVELGILVERKAPS